MTPPLIQILYLQREMGGMQFVTQSIPDAMAFLEALESAEADRPTAIAKAEAEELAAWFGTSSPES